MRYRIFALAVLFALLFSHSVLAEQEANILSDSGILCLVNREKHLPKDYAPSDLVKPKVDTRKSSLQDVGFPCFRVLHRPCRTVDFTGDKSLCA